jgi:Phosphoglycerol transferase and related proteins, alkaline phosphatase superfamily
MKRLAAIVRQICVFFLLLLSFSLIWCISNFGNIGLNEIVFTLNMPLKGTANSYFVSYFGYALLPTLILFGIGILLKFYPKKRSLYLTLSFGSRTMDIGILPIRLNGIVWLLVVLIWLSQIIGIANDNFELYAYLRSQIEASELIEKEYIDAAMADISFPRKKRNLIFIFVESAETSFMDKGNGGLLDENVIPEMTKLAKDNISFSHSELIEGAAVAPACGWTMAGLMAQTSGMPLKLFKYQDNTGGVDNSMDKYASFMPGLTSLGEILEDEGYHNFFLAGSDFEYAGRKDYFTQHGNYEIWDYNSAVSEGRIPENYEEGWGFEDAKLYTYAKEKLTELATEGEPFNFSMLTVDTHAGGGYLCELCPRTYESQYANVWACASRQLYDFVEWIKLQDFYENTVICITGDHSSMQTGFFEDYEYDKHEGDVARKVYNVFINTNETPVNMKNRKFTTLDMYPTVLASMGVKIEGERLGIGTNLFSGVPTLAEKYGYEELFAELNKKSRFYDNNILYPNK